MAFFCVPSAPCLKPQRWWRALPLCLALGQSATAEYIAELDGSSPASTLEHQSIADLPLYGWSVLEGSARIFDTDTGNGSVIAHEPFDLYAVQYVPPTPVPPQPNTRYTLRFDMGFVAGNTGGAAEYSFELGTLTDNVFTPLGRSQTGIIQHAGNLFSQAISGSDELVVVTGDSVSGQTLAVRWTLLVYDQSNGNSDFFGFDNVTLDAVPAVPDITPPVLLSASALQNQTITLVFDESVEPISATATSNYTFTGGISVSNITLHNNGKVVLLHVTGLSAETFVGSYSNVKDIADNVASGPMTGSILPFVSEDIGLLWEPGTAYSMGPDAVQIIAGGLDVWAEEDSMHFVYQERSGDFDVAVKIESFGPGVLPANAKTLLMIREDNTPGSRHVSVTTYPQMANWTAYQRQESYGASSVLPGEWRIPWNGTTQFPTWLRARRAGDSLSVYGSLDGEIWTQIGDAVVPEFPYENTVLVGVGVSAMTDNLANPFPATTVFSHFGDYSVPGGTLTFTQHPANLTVEENRPATFTAAVQVEGASAENVVYQWLRNGTPITAPNSPSYTLSLPTLDDSGAIFSVVASLPGGASVTSQTATLTVTPDTTLPTVLGASSVDRQSVLVRFSEALDPSRATDPANYQLSPSATVYEALLQPNGNSVLLMVDSLSGNSFTLMIDGVSDLAGNALNTTVTGEFFPWQSEDIGFVSTPSVAISPELGVIEITTTGADIWGMEDSFHFLYEPLTGEFDVRVQLSSITLTNPASRGGLMAREDLGPESRNIFAGTYPLGGQNNWVATVRPEPSATTTLGPGDSFPTRAAEFAFPHAWFRLLRAGQTFTTYYSTDGENWVQLGDQVTPEPPYPDTIYVGMATASINTAAPTIARYQNYGVTSTPPAATIALDITRAGNNLIVSWPAANADGYTLYSTTDFVTGNWAPVPTAPVLAGGNYQVTLPAPASGLFFRLQK